MSSYSRYPSLVRNLDPGLANTIEQYCLLSRIGDFKAAEQLWSGSLEMHSPEYLFAVSRVDAFLRQTRYGDSNDYLKRHRTALRQSATLSCTSSQKNLLSILQAYTEVYTEGKLFSAIESARRVWKFLAEEPIDGYDDAHASVRSRSRELC